MSEKDDYNYEKVERLGQLEGDLANSEVLLGLINDAISERLNEYYFERVLPLEKEIQKLGGVPPTTQNNTLEFLIRRCSPKNPFKEQGNYWENPNSDYYKFFEKLLHMLLEHNFIKVLEPLTLADVTSYWMFIFRCSEQLDFTLEKSSNDFVKACEWSGQANLSIYLIDELRTNYISLSAHNEFIQQHFLLKTKSVAQARDSSRNNKKGKPQGFELIENILLEITNSLE